MPGARVLVVDDEPDLLDLVQLDLELSGFDVDVAEDGLKAIERLHGERPDVVLLDVMMPRMDGWQVLARMRNDDRLADIPVVMLTALSGEVDRIRGQLSGAVRYVTKPFELAALLRAVGDALRPETPEIRAERRAAISDLLQRLAELETGRERGGGQVRLSRLETRRVEGSGPSVDPASVTELTSAQRRVAALLAAGVPARTIAARLDTSRANVYATRKRIARTLGIVPEQVAEIARGLGLDAEVGHLDPSVGDEPEA